MMNKEQESKKCTNIAKNEIKQISLNRNNNPTQAYTI